MRWSVKADPGVTVVRQRLIDPPPDNPARMRAHPGREWLVVLSGTAILMLGRRRFRIETNQAAEFPTMMPHAIGAEGGPCEILVLFDRDARRGHQRDDGSLSCTVATVIHGTGAALQGEASTMTEAGKGYVVRDAETIGGQGGKLEPRGPTTK